MYLKITKGKVQTMILNLNFFLNFVEKNLHNVIVKNAEHYIYIVPEVSKILINLYFENNWSKILKTGKSEDEIFQISYDLNGRRESLKFDLNTKEMTNYKELNEIYTEILFVD